MNKNGFTRIQFIYLEVYVKIIINNRWYVIFAIYIIKISSKVFTTPCTFSLDSLGYLPHNQNQLQTLSYWRKDLVPETYLEHELRWVHEASTPSVDILHTKHLLHSPKIIVVVNNVTQVVMVLLHCGTPIYLKYNEIIEILGTT